MRLGRVVGKTRLVSGVPTIKIDIETFKKTVPSVLCNSHLCWNHTIWLENSRLNRVRLVSSLTSERVFLERPISFAFQRVIDDCFLVAFGIILVNIEFLVCVNGRMEQENL